MPLRYSKDRLKILKSVAALQRRGAVDETLYRHFLRKYGKALRQLQRIEDKKRWDVLRRATKPVSEEALQAYLEGRWPHIYKEELRTLLFEHGTDAYKKLVRGAKIGPLI